MTLSTGFFSLLLLGIISTGTGQLTVQSDWVFPQSPDYSTVVSIGSTVYFQWTSNLQNQFGAYLPNGNVSHVDVWVTGETIIEGYHKLAANFDVSSTQSFPWTVIVPAEELERETTWVFRFVALGDDPAHLDYQISSPVFQIVDNTKSKMASSSSSVASSTTSSSSTSSPSSSTTSTSLNSTTPQIISTTSASATSTTTPILHTTTLTLPSTTPTGTSSNSTAPPPQNPPPAALSTGTKIGIAVGASAAAICTCSLLLFLCSRRRKLRHYASHGRVRMTGDPIMEIQQDVSYALKGKA